MSNNKIMEFSYFYWNTNEKKKTTKQPYFTMESAMTAILRDASGKMYHGILFDHPLDSLTKLWTLDFVWSLTLDLVFFMISHTHSMIDYKLFHVHFWLVTLISFT